MGRSKGAHAALDLDHLRMDGGKKKGKGFTLYIVKGEQYGA